jgi:hypothetical protein
MIKMRTKGDWKQFLSLMNSYSKRVAYVRFKISLEIAKAFLARLIKEAPKGDEYDAYIGSLKVVKLVGNKGFAAHAVISERMKIRVGDVLADKGAKEKAVVYVEPSQGGGSPGVVDLIAENNPWPVSMLPHGIPRGEAVMIHRLVTEGEMKWVKEQTAMFISNNRGEFRSHGVYWGEIEDQDTAVEGMESLPDYMTLAIRAEFGINAEQHAHWKPSLKWVAKNVDRIAKEDREVHAALHNWLFRGHTLSNTSKLSTISLGNFDKEVGSFEKMVSPGV